MNRRAVRSEDFRAGFHDGTYAGMAACDEVWSAVMASQDIDMAHRAGEMVLARMGDVLANAGRESPHWRLGFAAAIAAERASNGPWGEMLVTRLRSGEAWVFAGQV